MRFILSISALAVLAACATPPGRIKPISNIGECTAEDREKLAKLSQGQSNRFVADTFGVILVGIPVGSLATNDREGEIAILKGRCEQ